MMKIMKILLITLVIKSLLYLNLLDFWEETIVEDDHNEYYLEIRRNMYSYLKITVG